MRIALLNRAKMNSGDHLIFYSTKKIMEHLGHDVVEISSGWKRFDKDKLKLVNKCNALMIAGGPCVSPRIYPTIYPLFENLRNIKPQIILFGVGLKVGSNSKTNFKFTSDSLRFLNRSKIYTRDEITKQFFDRLNISCKFSGCSSWLNGGNLVKSFKPNSIKNILFSARRITGAYDIEVLNILLNKFKGKNISVALNHGFEPKRHSDLIKFCKQKKLKILDISGECNKMRKISKNCDIHIGFRVHTHLCCLSQGTKSILIKLDSRGAGQSKSVGTHRFDINTKELSLLGDRISLAIEDDYKEVIKNINARYRFAKREFYE